MSAGTESLRYALLSLSPSPCARERGHSLYLVRLLLALEAERRRSSGSLLLAPGVCTSGLLRSRRAIAGLHWPRFLLGSWLHGLSQFDAYLLGFREMSEGVADSLAVSFVAR